jgi:RNA polymerase sporulation-specific sigma factor
MMVRLSEMNLPRFPLLSEQEVMVLLKKVKKGDKEARDTLVNCNLRLVFNLVKRFENRGYELEDLFQIGTIGLMKSIDKFDFTYNVKFSTYAVPMILGEIRRFVRDDNPVKVSRAVKETAYKVHQTIEKMSKELGREPSIGEVAEGLCLSREDVVAALEAIQAPASIHETFYQDNGDPIYILDQLRSEVKEEAAFNKIALKEVMQQLPPKQRRIILLRFFQDMTQSQVAEKIGLSQVQVSRLERRALKSIKNLLNGPDEPQGRS